MRQMKTALLAVLCLLVFFSLLACDGGQAPSPNEGEGAGEEPCVTADELMRSVLALTCDMKNEYGTVVATSDGSAVILSLEENGDAYLLTNFHVVHHSYKGGDAVCDSITAAPVGAEEVDGIAATCLWFSRDYDLAFLHIAGLTEIFPGAKPARLNRERKASVADTVYAVGNTRGLGVSVHTGTISRAYEYVTLPVSYQVSTIRLRLIRFDALVGKGDSGGALFSSDGSLLGIVNARQTDNGGGYAIPIATVAPIVDKLLATAAETPVAEGFYFGATLSERVLRTEFDETTGTLRNVCEVYVKSFAYGSVASAFLQEGDVLLSLSIGERRVSFDRLHHASDAFLSVRASDSLTFSFLRNGESMQYTFTVAPTHMKPIA